MRVEIRGGAAAHLDVDQKNGRKLFHMSFVSQETHAGEIPAREEKQDLLRRRKALVVNCIHQAVGRSGDAALIDPPMCLACHKAIGSCRSNA